MRETPRVNEDEGGGWAFRRVHPRSASTATRAAAPSAGAQRTTQPEPVSLYLLRRPSTLTDHDGRRDSVSYVSLISLTFRNGVIAATVVVALTTVLLWNRIPGPRAVRAFTRALFLLAGQFLAVVALLVTVNIAAGGLV